MGVGDTESGPINFNRRNAVIRATGIYAPKRILPNSYFNELLGQDVDTWLREHLGILERRWCKEDESTADMCVFAAEEALQKAGLTSRDLDLIIVATDTPEYLTPATATVVQYRLRAERAGTFDLNSACAGFVTGMDVAAKYIRTDERYQNVMVIGAYAMSKYLDPKDKKTVTLYADGAGAIILTADNDTKRGYLGSELLTLGQYHDGMGIYGGGAKMPFSEEVLAKNQHTFKRNYRFPPELNLQVWTHMARNLCERLKIQPEEVEHYLLTQININTIRQTMDNLNVPHERAHVAVKYRAYTGSACIPTAFYHALEAGKVQENDLIFMIGSGSGLTFSSVAFRY
jgi:3-oxoacyl-[acyl-carrier-protein] synthase-3